MSTEVSVAAWWKLHRRRARGETLSPDEQQLYDSELARLDHLMPIINDSEALRQLRAATLALEQENADLRARLAQLATEIAQLKAAQQHWSVARPALQLEPLPDDDWFFRNLREAIEEDRRLASQD